MEKMPYRDGEQLDVHAALAGNYGTATSSDWRQALPVLTGTLVTLRELRLSDAPSLLAMLSTEEVSRFISPPPTIFPPPITRILSIIPILLIPTYPLYELRNNHAPPRTAVAVCNTTRFRAVQQRALC